MADTPTPSEIDAVIVALLCSDDHDMSQIDCYLNNLGIVQQVRAGAEHNGDCTKQVHTCFVCLVAETEKRAKAFLATMPDEHRVK